MAGPKKLVGTSNFKEGKNYAIHTVAQLFYKKHVLIEATYFWLKQLQLIVPTYSARPAIAWP